MNNMVQCSSVNIGSEAFCILFCGAWSQLRQEKEYTGPIIENLVKTEGHLCVPQDKSKPTFDLLLASLQNFANP